MKISLMNLWNSQVTHVKVHFELHDELNLMKQVYDRVASDEVMMKCMWEKNQNPNESLRRRIWEYCLKHKNASKEMLDFATATDTAFYNAGYVGSNINNLLGIPYSRHTDNHLKPLIRPWNSYWSLQWGISDFSRTFRGQERVILSGSWVVTCWPISTRKSSQNASYTSSPNICVMFGPISGILEAF